MLTFDYEHRDDITGDVLDGGEDVPIKDMESLLQIFHWRVENSYVNEDNQEYDEDSIFVILKVKEE